MQVGKCRLLLYIGNTRMGTHPEVQIAVAKGLKGKTCPYLSHSFMGGVGLGRQMHTVEGNRAKEN